jgi:hypothetical protein
MFSKLTRFFRRRETCDCCNHNNDSINIALLLANPDDLTERQTMKRRLKNLYASLRWKNIKVESKKRKVTASKMVAKRFKLAHKKLRHMGSKKSLATDTVADTNEEAGKQSSPLNIEVE